MTFEQTGERVFASYPAVPYREFPMLMENLRARTSISAGALEFTILTAARSNEVLAAQRSDFDLANA